MGHLIRHRQRAITSLTPKGSKWINPQKFAIPTEPIFALPTTYYHLGATEGATADVWRANQQETYDLNSLPGEPWQLVFKIRLTAGGTGANQVIFQQSGTNKRFMWHNVTGAFRWVDDPALNITWTDPADVGSVVPLFDTWYLVHIRNDLDVPGNTKLQLFTLPSEDLENGDLFGEKSVAELAGSQSSVPPFIGAGSTGPPTLGLRGDLANVIWGVNTVQGSLDDFLRNFKHHWPINEGVGLSINDITAGATTGDTPGDAGSWGTNP